MTVPSVNLAILGLIGLYAALALLERLFPLRRRTQTLAFRLLANACLSGLAFLIGGSLVRPIGIGLATWSNTQPFGLLHVVALPGILQFLSGFLLLDLSFYYWHRLNHSLPFLWRFHNVHHIDHDLDVLTSFRFHFGEIFLSVGFRAVQVGTIGVSPLTYVIYEAFFQSETVFHHSNLRLPVRFERWLNKIFVTPRMHGIHHSIVKDETNSNYSVVFSWWDRIHRTLQLNVAQSDITVGVAAYLDDPESKKLSSLLCMPFREQKDYWVLSDGTRPTRQKTMDKRYLLE